MLDQQDIQQIGNIVEEKVNTMGKGLEERLGLVIEEKIEQRVGVIVEEKVNAMGRGLEQRLETKIGQVVEEKIDKAIEEKIIPSVTEVVHNELGAVLEDNILPVMEEMNTHLTKVESNMVTKDYLDDKLADLRGDLIGIDRQQDKKVNFMIESLDSSEILPDSDIKLLRQMEVFPSPPRPNI